MRKGVAVSAVFVLFLAGCGLFKSQGEAAFSLEIVSMPSIVTASLESDELVSAVLEIKNTADRDMDSAHVSTAYLRHCEVEVNFKTAGYSFQKILNLAAEIEPGETETVRVVLLTLSELSLLRHKLGNLESPVSGTARITIHARDVFGNEYVLETSLGIELQ